MSFIFEAGGINILRLIHHTKERPTYIDAHKLIQNIHQPTYNRIKETWGWGEDKVDDYDDLRRQRRLKTVDWKTKGMN